VADTEDNAQGSANGRLLIIGGGISGMTVALEAAETGREVVLVERSAYLGGRVVQSNQYFPKLCPPSCGLEINLKRLRANPRIRVYTLAEVEKVAGGKGNFEITVRQNPRFVNEKCTACDDCTAVCPVERDNPFNYGLDKTKAIYQPHQRSFPLRHVIDMTVCQGKDCNKCVAACKYDAIELDMQPRTFTVQAASVVIATGWQPPDATKLEKLGFGQYPNVITNVMMERLAAPDGPTGGKLLRPSDGHPAKKVAFVQCAGSRDENHYPYCSGVCCLASLKQATYVRESGADAEARIFYIDVRATGRLEDFFTRVSSDEKVSLNKGKVANIEEDPTTHNLFVEAEDTLSGRKLREEADLVVLATGMTPCDGLPELPLNVPRDDYGFFVDDDSRNGIYAVGCAKKPVDVATCVRDATGVALKAMQAERSLRRQAKGVPPLAPRDSCRTSRTGADGTQERIVDKKIGAYICSGCGIGDCLDVEQAAKEGADGVKPALCRTHAALCSDEGLDLIRKDMAEEGVNTLVIGACSPRMMTEQFNFDRTTTHVERVNLREQVAWSHEPGEENTQELAEDYVRMGLARAAKAKLPEPVIPEINKTILVVGGGVAGLTAAHEAARAGYDVALVEREAELGGWAAKFPKHTPRRPPYDTPVANGLPGLIAKVQGHEKIRVFTSTGIEQTAGAPGMFDVTLRNASTETLRIGAIIQTTGWSPYDAGKLSALGFGQSPDVITNVQFEELAAGSPGQLTRPSDGSAARRIVFVQCAGSRDSDHLEYCSGVCCATTLKQALCIRERDPEAQVYIVYKDMRTPGQAEEFYRRVQEEEGVFFTKGEVTGVHANGNGSVAVDARDTLLGESIRLEADLVVLATGMVPNAVAPKRLPGVADEEDKPATAPAATAACEPAEARWARYSPSRRRPTSPACSTCSTAWARNCRC